MRFALLCLSLFATTARVDEPMSGDEFEAYVTGRTITYSNGYEGYGIERYRAGRGVTWAALGGDCIEGTWYEPEKGRICFTYDSRTMDVCWAFFDTGAGLRAELLDTPLASYLYELVDDPRPLVCPGYGV